MYFRRGIFGRDDLRKLGKSRTVLFCEACLEKGLKQEDSPDLSKKIREMLALADSLPFPLVMKEAQNKELLAKIMFKLASSQSQVNDLLFNLKFKNISCQQFLDITKLIISKKQK